MNKFVQCISQDTIDYAAVNKHPLKLSVTKWQVYLLHGAKYMVLINGSRAGKHSFTCPQKRKECEVRFGQPVALFLPHEVLKRFVTFWGKSLPIATGFLEKWALSDVNTSLPDGLSIRWHAHLHFYSSCHAAPSIWASIFRCSKSYFLQWSIPGPRPWLTATAFTCLPALGPVLGYI